MSNEMKVVVDSENEMGPSEKIPALTSDEKTKSQKTQAFVFDSLVDANLKLVAAINRLVRVSYVTLTTMVLLVLIMIILALARLH